MVESLPLSLPLWRGHGRLVDRESELRGFRKREIKAASTRGLLSSPSFPPHHSACRLPADKRTDTDRPPTHSSPSSSSFSLFPRDFCTMHGRPARLCFKIINASHNRPSPRVPEQRELALFPPPSPPRAAPRRLVVRCCRGPIRHPLPPPSLSSRHSATDSPDNSTLLPPLIPPPPPSRLSIPISVAISLLLPFSLAEKSLFLSLCFSLVRDGYLRGREEREQVEFFNKIGTNRWSF